MKKVKFEDLNSEIFKPLDIEKMKRIKGGYTLNTITVYSSGGASTDGTGSQDGVYND